MRDREHVASPLDHQKLRALRALVEPLADGEWNQAKETELVIEAVPKALRVRVPRGD